jgi:hypothetical protein
MVITCAKEGCIKRPRYNYWSEKKGLYCFEHKLDLMLDVLSKKCRYDQCCKRPTCNYSNEKNGVYCSTHKLEGMVDVLSKKCLHCDKIPAYNIPNETVIQAVVENITQLRQYLTKINSVINSIQVDMESL